MYSGKKKRRKTPLMYRVACSLFFYRRVNDDIMKPIISSALRYGFTEQGSVLPKQSPVRRKRFPFIKNDSCCMLRVPKEDEGDEC